MINLVDAIKEIGERVKCSEWAEKNYVDCISLEALKAIIRYVRRGEKDNGQDS